MPDGDAAREGDRPVAIARGLRCNLKIPRLGLTHVCHDALPLQSPDLPIGPEGLLQLNRHTLTGDVRSVAKPAANLSFKLLAG